MSQGPGALHHQLTNISSHVPVFFHSSLGAPTWPRPGEVFTNILDWMQHKSVTRTLKPQSKSITPGFTVSAWIISDFFLRPHCVSDTGLSNLCASHLFLQWSNEVEGLQQISPVVEVYVKKKKKLRIFLIHFFSKVGLFHWNCTD